MAEVVNAKTLGLIGKKVKMKRNVKRLLEEMPKMTKDKVYSYWHSLDLNSKKEFLRIKVDDFTSHFEMSETPDCELGVFVNHVKVRAHARKHWITWLCVSCEDTVEEFDDPKYHRNHLALEHVENMMSSLILCRRHWPRSDERQCNEMIKMIHRCSWKPVDISAAIEMLENQVKSVGDSVTKVVQDWPLSDDCKRTEFLKRIKDKFHELIQHKFFAPSHLTHVINVAKDEIFGLNSSQILGHALDQSLDCICFLGVTGLKKVFKFMVELSHTCGLVLHSNKSRVPSGDLPKSIQVPTDIKEEIRLSEDASYFLLDGCLVTTTSSTKEGAILEDVISNIDSFLPWIFSGSCLGEWERWGDEKNIKINRAIVHVHNLQNLSDFLKKSVEEKCRLTDYDKALKGVDDLCRGVENGNFTESILRERKEELSNIEEHVSDKFELDAISNVLEEAQKLKVNEFDYDKSYVKMAIEQLKLTQSEKFGKIDGEILKTHAEIRGSIIEFCRDTRFDYRLGFLPLAKAYLKARLIASFERDATMKADALLSELDEESNKNIKGRCDSAKQYEKTTKNKKSDKKNRKKNKLKTTNDTELVLADLAEELEAIFDYEQHNLDTTIDDHSPVAHDEKSHHEVRLEELEAQKKEFTETEKEVEAAEKLIEEMKTELEEKRNLHAQELTKLQKDEENIKNALKNHAEKGKELDAEENFIHHMVAELREKKECLVKHLGFGRS